MAGIHFKVTGDANGYIAATRQAEAATGKMVGSITDEAKKIDSIFKTLATGVGTLFTVQMASQFSKQVAQVRGEFQQLEVAFETMLQSKEKADALMAQVVDTAAKTPFDLQGVASGAKQLLAYGVASEEVNDTLIRLGDIAAGLSIPLNDLVYLYGTTMTQGRLFTQDLRQFQGRGIPIAEELAKQFGVAKDKVGELVTAGKVGFPEVQKAIMAMTSEGGKFNNLMAKQSQTITGQISNLEDSISQMFNEIGKSSEGIISGAIDIASSLVENYEKVGHIVASLVTTFGAYKAAVIAVTAVEKVQAMARLAAIKNTTLLQVATGVLTKKMGLLNVVMNANPYVLAATALIGLGTAVWALSDQTTAAEKAQKRYNKAQEDAAQLENQRKQEIEEALDIARDSNRIEGERVEALLKLKAAYPEIFSQYDLEKLKLADILDLKKQIAEEDRKKKTTSIEEDYAANAKWLNKNRQTYNSGGKAFRKEYETRQEEQKLARQDYTDTKVEDYIASMKDQSTEYLQQVLDIAQRANVGNGQFLLEGTKVMSKGMVDLTQLKTLSIEGQNLVAIIESINAELTKRNEVVPSFADEFKAAEEAWKTEKAKLEAIKKDKEKYTKKEYEDAVASEEEKRKAFEALGGDTKGKTDKYNDAIRKAAEAEAKLKNDYANKTLREQENIDNQVEQSRIDAMAEGSEKVLAQMELDHAKELQQIQREKEDYIDAVVEREKAIFDAEENAKKAKNKDYQKQTFDEDAVRKRVSESSGAKAYDRIAYNTVEKHRREEAEVIKQTNDELLRKYEDYASGILRIDKELNADLAKMRDSDGNPLSGFSQKNIDIAIKQAEDAKDALAVSFAAETAEFNVFVSTLADKSIKELTLMLAEAEIELSTLEDMGGDSGELARARAEVVKLEAQIKKLRMDKGVKESTTSWADLSNVLKDASDTFSELGSIIPGIQGQMLAGIGSIASAAVGMANGIQAIGKAASAAEKASAILAVISAAIQVVQFFTSALKENEEANLKTAKATHSYLEALEDLEESSNKAKNSTLFGDDPFGGVSNSAENAQKHLADLSSSLENISLFSEDDLVDFTMKSSGWSTFSKKYRDVVEKLTDIGSTALVSDNRSGWQKFWGIGNDNLVVEDLTNFIGEDGNLKGEELKAWYKAYGEGLSDEDKLIVEGLIHDWDDYAAAMEEVASYVKSIFGDMSSQIADSMIESWQKTGDAIADTKKILGDYAKTFAKSMIESMLVQQVFTDDIQQQMVDLMSTGDTEGALSLTSQLLDQANALAPQINEYLNGVNDMTGGALKGDAESTRESVSKGIAQASQDSVDELNGRMTAVQSHTFSINERVGTIVNLTSQILAKVTSIDGHTARLETIETNTANMADYLSDILTRGITVK